MIAAILLLLISTLLLIKGTPITSSAYSNATTFQTETQSAASNSTDLQKDYIRKIRKYEPTRHLIDQVPSDMRSFRTRKCRCDAECTTYGDCCLDSKYYNRTEQRINSRKFCCMPSFQTMSKCASITRQVVLQIYAIVTCPSTYTNAEVKSECELSKIYPPKNGMKFQTPVANTELGLIYGNEYCALCNSVSTFQAWNVSFACHRELTETVVDTFPIHVDAKHVSFNVTKNKFVSFLNGSHFQCEKTRSWKSPDLKQRSCIDAVSTRPPGIGTKNLIRPIVQLPVLVTSRPLTAFCESSQDKELNRFCRESWQLVDTPAPVSRYRWLNWPYRPRRPR